MHTDTSTNININTLTVDCRQHNFSQTSDCCKHSTYYTFFYSSIWMTSWRGDIHMSIWGTEAPPTWGKGAEPKQLDRELRGCAEGLDKIRIIFNHKSYKAVLFKLRISMCDECWKILISRMLSLQEQHRFSCVYWALCSCMLFEHMDRSKDLKWTVDRFYMGYI